MDNNQTTTPFLYDSPLQKYQTQNQAKTAYDYAKALMYGNGQQPVHHWTQGVSNMVAALVGGNLDYRTAQNERTAKLFDAGQDPTITSQNPTASVPPNVGVGKTSFNYSPSSAGSTNAGGDLDRAADAIASIESKGSGDYSAVGPTTKSGDRAYGKYQVMGVNIPQWTAEVLGKKMTPEEFLRDQAAQDQVFRAKFGQAEAKYGNPQDAASVWFTGQPQSKGGSRSDGYITGNQYVDRFNKAYGSPSLAFAGPQSDVSQAPAVQAVTAALRGEGPSSAPVAMPVGDTQVAASSKLPLGGGRSMTQYPAPGQQIYINPALIGRGTQYTEEQFRNLMASDNIPNEMKAQIRAEAAAQNQPRSIPYLGGAVVVDPRNPSVQQFIPQGDWSDKKLGDMQTKVFRYFDPKTGAVIEAPIQFGTHGGQPTAPAGAVLGPRSEAVPAPGVPNTAAGAPGVPTNQAPVGPANAPSAVRPSGSPALAQSAPQATPGATNAPIRVASTDPAAGVRQIAVSKPAAPAVSPADAPADTPLGRFAQANPPGLRLNGFSPEDTADYTAKKAFDAKMAVDEDAQKKAADFAAKKYDILSQEAATARKEMPNLDLGLAMMNDPNFHSGLLSGAQDVWSRFKAAVLGDQYANAPNETFDKLMAGNILNNMHTALGGLGQVRLAEIALLSKANANRNNTDASNRAVLEVSKRAVQSLDNLDQIGQQYVSGDEVVDPISGKVLLKANIGPDGEIAPRRGLDVGYDKLARKFITEHPSFTDDEIKRYNTIFDTGRDPNQAAGTNAPPRGTDAGQTGDADLPPAAVSRLKAGTATTFDNGQKWTIGPDGKPQRVQ